MEPLSGECATPAATSRVDSPGQTIRRSSRGEVWTPSGRSTRDRRSAAGGATLSDRTRFIVDRPVGPITVPFPSESTAFERMRRRTDRPQCPVDLFRTLGNPCSRPVMNRLLRYKMTVRPAFIATISMALWSV